MSLKIKKDKVLQYLLTQLEIKYDSLYKNKSSANTVSKTSLTKNIFNNNDCKRKLSWNVLSINCKVNGK